ncbi:hypothetical protein E2C01_084639 [Portunus trituberculatus]|uniref:Uncharacterized protein n=1 Tax=Portunus trituberculatus TaxID=210409 RepID=A0A5B7J4J9_PORTR|nr:hypothetical protein [Portunus trituberculatus]
MHVIGAEATCRRQDAINSPGQSLLQAAPPPHGRSCLASRMPRLPTLKAVIRGWPEGTEGQHLSARSGQPPLVQQDSSPPSRRLSSGIIAIIRH